MLPVPKELNKFGEALSKLTMMYIRLRKLRYAMSFLEDSNRSPSSLFSYYKNIGSYIHTA